MCTKVDASGSLWRGGKKTGLGWGPKGTATIVVSSEFLYKKNIFLYYLFHEK